MTSLFIFFKQCLQPFSRASLHKQLNFKFVRYSILMKRMLFICSIENMKTSFQLGFCFISILKV